MNNKVPTRPAWVPEDLYPFQSRYADADGCRVHYIDEGEGRVLLFLHGNPTWSFVYRNIVRALRDDFRCIALDFPGFGLSQAPAGYGFTPGEHAAVVGRFVDSLELNDVTLVAQDWGGPIGLTVAARRPEVFSGFVLGNTWAWPLNGQLQFETFARIMGGPLGKLLIRNANAFVNVMIPLGSAKRPDKRVMEAYRGPFSTKESRDPTHVFPKALLKSKRFLEDLERDLPTITHLPTLLLWGAGDMALRAGVEMRRLRALFPQHEVVTLTGARHYFQEDAPDRAANAIRRWMDARAAG